MADQALALLLADALEGRAERAWTRAEVAAELRRLSAVNQDLLEALRWTARALHAEHPAAIKARAAIAKAEEKV